MRRTIALVALGAIGLGACSSGAGETLGPASSTPAPAPATTDTTTTTTSAPRPTTAAARRTTSTTDATVAPTTTVPASTIAPIVTYPADVGILAPVAVAAPVSVDIPSLGTTGRVLPVGVNAADELDVPPDAQTLVWYQHGPTPGAMGSAVIAGHLNWKGVEGVFSELASTPIGELVRVAYDDGTTKSFTVTAVELVEKPAIAVHGVFDRSGESVLRLVTCGGEFDASRRSYKSNVVLTAVPTP